MLYQVWRLLSQAAGRFGRWLPSQTDHEAEANQYADDVFCHRDKFINELGPLALA